MAPSTAMPPTTGPAIQALLEEEEEEEEEEEAPEPLGLSVAEPELLDEEFETLFPSVTAA